jgi:hypothetical protein
MVVEQNVVRRGYKRTGTGHQLAKRLTVNQHQPSLTMMNDSYPLVTILNHD